jgi:hypothetical protein
MHRGTGGQRAYANHVDRETGAIEVGHYADLTALDRDPFDRPAAETPRCLNAITVMPCHPTDALAGTEMLSGASW